MAMTITRKGRWGVGEDEHNEVHEAFENAQNRALAAPGTIIDVTPPGYEVIFKDGFDPPPVDPPPVDPPPPDPPVDPVPPTTSGPFAFQNVTQQLFVETPDSTYRFDALFHDFAGTGRPGVMIFGHGDLATTRLWDQNTDGTFDLVPNGFAHYYIPEPASPRGSGWLTLIDVNGDGRQDFWTWDADILSAWYENGTSGPPWPVFAGKHAASRDHTVFGQVLADGLQQVNEHRRIADIESGTELIPASDKASDHIVVDLTGNSWADIVAPRAGGYWRNTQGAFTWVPVPGLSCDEPLLIAADFGNSGHMDLLTLDATGAHLWRNNDGTLIEVTAGSGLEGIEHIPYWTGYGNVIAADLNNTGLQDMVFAGISRSSTVVVYRNLGDYRFERTELDFGPSDGNGPNGYVSGKPRCAVADYDNDGLLDIVKTQHPTNVGLWRNTTETTNHWLKVRCHGPGRNSDGIGAAVKLYRPGTTQLVSHMAVQASNQHPQTRLHMGASDCTIVDVVVTFPCGAGSYTFPGVATDQSIRVHSDGTMSDSEPPPDPDPEPPVEPPPLDPDPPPDGNGLLAVDLIAHATSGPRFEQFISFVDRAVAGDAGYNFSALDAAIAHEMTDDTRYRDLAVSTALFDVDAALEAAQAGYVPNAGHDSYYFATSEIVPVAFVFAWYRDQMTNQQRSNCAWYCERTVWNIWHHEQAHWGGVAHPWSGWATDNPANNYYYNFALTTMAWALASGDPVWLDKVREDLLPTLQAHLATLPGGGSLEGTGYGLSHSRLFELLQLWKDSTGEDWTTAHVAGSIDYWSAATTPDFKHCAVIGDQSRVSDGPLYDYHRLLMLRARHLTADLTRRNRATWWLHRVPELVQDGFNARGNLLPAGDIEAVPPLTYHASGVGHLFARSGHGADALWFNFIAGPYTESHSAQEQGGFTMYKAGWLSVAENTFSHSGIKQGTEGRNVPRFEQNGEIIEQRYYPRDSAQATMYEVEHDPATGHARATANLLPAYKGQDAVVEWTRSVELAGNALTVTDTFGTGPDTEAIWQLQVPDEPTVNGNVITAGGLTITVLEPVNAVIELFDWTSLGSEYSRGWRIDVKGGIDVYQVLIDVTGNGVPS